jgi:hypothetical protein
MKKSTKKALLVVGGLGIVGTVAYLLLRPKSLPTSQTGKSIAAGGAAGGASQPT